jgi:predicted nucleic acid-binding protein
LTLVVDTGVLLAALDTKDPDHAPCVELLSGRPDELVVPTATLIELDYFLRKRGAHEAWLGFCQDVAAGGYTLFDQSPLALLEAAHLQRTYADLRLGLVDASVFVTCVDLGVQEIATLDRRHFSVLRLPDGGTLEIFP